MNLVLPFPPKELSPNARLHHMALARAKKAYRTRCAWEAKAQGVTRIEAERLSVHFTFFPPPPKRRRDLDGLIARMKSGIDGLVDVLGVDDSKWHMSFIISDEPLGMVRVEVLA